VTARKGDATTGAEPVRLRGHHFICLQFFRGEGYSATFVDNLSRVIERAAENPALLVEGADDVCAACPGLAADSTCVDPQAGECEVRRLDRLASDVLGIKPGAALSLARARELLAADAISAGRWRIEACAGCTWEDVCESGWGALLGAAEAAARVPAESD
jgi:hypothetical protein